jgi:hypothetical protein
MSHVGWSSPATARYYLQLANILKAGAPADLLSQNVSPDNPAADIYRDFNHLKNFILAFPSTELLQRKAPDS